MKAFFYNLFKNIAALYRGPNLFWQLVFIALTFVLVVIGFDWWYYQVTQDNLLQMILFPAVIIGFLFPIIAPLALFLYGALAKSKRTINAAFAITQAGLLGLGISSLYKVFTGRVGLPHGLSTMDTSTVFRFGFLRGGAFQGWPSSHTSVAFAMSMALVTLYPENKVIKYGAPLYALYVGLGVSATIHWFSDFVAGAILGILIGFAVGKSFLARGTALSK